MILIFVFKPIYFFPIWLINQAKVVEKLIFGGAGRVYLNNIESIINLERINILPVLSLPSRIMDCQNHGSI